MGSDSTLVLRFVDLTAARDTKGRFGITFALYTEPAGRSMWQQMHSFSYDHILFQLWTNYMHTTGINFHCYTDDTELHVIVKVDAH